MLWYTKRKTAFSDLHRLFSKRRLQAIWKIRFRPDKRSTHSWTRTTRGFERIHLIVWSEWLPNCFCVHASACQKNCGAYQRNEPVQTKADFSYPQSEIEERRNEYAQRTYYKDRKLKCHISSFATCILCSPKKQNASKSTLFATIVNLLKNFWFHTIGTMDKSKGLW